MKTTKRQHALEPIKLDAYKPLREVVSETLRQAIKDGVLKPGERLMEIQLADELGVSRTQSAKPSANWNWKASSSWFPGAGRMSPIFP